MSRLLLLTLIVALAAPVFAEPGAREKELTYLRTILSEDLLPYANLEVPAAENLAIAGAGADQHLGLHIFPGQKKRNGGIRAEVSVDFPFTAGETVRYEWKLMVPPGFKTDAPRNRWWIIAQWHDQPDKSRGETWSGFPSRSPPVLLGLGEVGGRIGFGFEYGIDHAQKKGPFFLEPGKWHTLAMVVRWSQQADGRAALYLDEMAKPVAVAEGANMHNGYQHFLKLGMYRHLEIQNDNWIYLDAVRITREAGHR